MCAICGIYDFREAPVDPVLLERMGSVMKHRGPDGAGTYLANGIGLGNRRLSIIDIDGGSQPISNEDASLQVVFNGEIYNFVELREELQDKGHIFKTRSDTEVIIHGYEEWGLDCVSRFNGIFAFALYDQNRRQLLLTRDHLGVKPLYYAVLGNRLVFASEIKALLTDSECPREIDLQALGQLFTLRYVPSPNTLFRGIKKLPPGHLMLVSPKGFEVRRYWRWTPQIDQEGGEGLQAEIYRMLLEDAVRLQMRSDVPVGLFLSSGIDSGALLALMTKYSVGRVHTFTIGFEDGERSNENPEARVLAERFGTDHTEMVIGPKDYETYFERYLWDLEEPVGHEAAAAFYFVSKLASRKVKVALCGQGADEPWAGYDRYVGIKLSELYSRFPAFLTQGLVGQVVEHFARNEKLRRGAVALYERDVLTRFIKVYSFYSAAMKTRLFQPWLQQEISADGHEAKQALRRLQGDVEDLDPLTQMLYIDTRANLPDDLLMVADKTAMANSVEARVPYLDYRLIEFIEALPPHLKLRGFVGKYLHKKAVQRWLPKKTIYRKKKGFENPIDKWLRSRMNGFIGDCLLSESAAVGHYFERDYIKELVSQHQTNQQNHLRHINLLISFELWHRTFLSA